VLTARGDPEVRVHLRSAAKPFQAYALVASGAADRFGLSDEELAVVCGSHLGEPRHVEVVSGLLARLGLGPEVLECGPGSPESAAARVLAEEGFEPSPLHHMCSGKHAGMAVLALHLGLPAEGYSRPDHPVQELIARSIRALLLQPADEDIRCGVDGCGVPVFRITARQAAALYARLAAGRDPVFARLVRAMADHPELVCGPGSLDTAVMRAYRQEDHISRGDLEGGDASGAGSGGVARPGAFVAKMGASGVQAFGLPPEVASGGGVGVGCFMKIACGSSLPIAAVSALLLQSWGLFAPANAALSVARRMPPFSELELLLHEDDLRLDRFPQSSVHPDYSIVREEPAHRRTRRFLGDGWPGAEEELFGRRLDWTVIRATWAIHVGRRIGGVLRGSWAGGVATVEELLVDGELRGQGLGANLLRRFEREAAEAGCHKVMLATKAASQAERFYRRHGYVRSYLLPHHHHKIDSLGMYKWLGPENSRR